MRVSDAFPSNYLKAADLQGRNVLVTIERVEIEKVGEDHKPVIYFRGKQKGLVANKTNCNAIAAVHGDEMDDWSGCEVVLFPIMTDFQGKPVEAIRVRGPQPKDRKPKPQAEQPMQGRTETFCASDPAIRPHMSEMQEAPPQDELNDPIPF